MLRIPNEYAAKPVFNGIMATHVFRFFVVVVDRPWFAMWGKEMLMPFSMAVIGRIKDHGVAGTGA